MAIQDIVSSRAMSIKEAKFEGAVASLIREWSLKYPDEVVALDKMTHNMRRERAYRKGFDGEKLGNMAHFAEVPVTLHKMMRMKVHKDWINRQDIASIFFRHFRVGLLNLNSMADFEK